MLWGRLCRRILKQMYLIANKEAIAVIREAMLAMLRHIAWH